MSKDSNPFISVVIPNHNNAERLDLCLKSLFNQTLSDHRYEVIVIDNNSTDHSHEIISRYPATLLEYKSKNNPYPVRNYGIRQARGPVIALTDAKCIPAADWLECGLRRLEEGADMVGGRFNIEMSPEQTTAEMTYALIHLVVDPKHYDNTPVALTGNLFAYKSLFEELGYYQEEERSGADVEFSQRVLAAGKKVVYGPEVLASYPAKQKGALLNSAFRDGKSYKNIWLKNHSSFRRWIFGLRAAFPLWPSTVHKLIDQRGQPGFHEKRLQIWWMIWRVRLNHARGILSN